MCIFSVNVYHMHVQKVYKKNTDPLSDIAKPPHDTPWPVHRPLQPFRKPALESR